MIHSLTVENIALIDKLEIEFSEGLNILTGETGAGKSIIVDSMNLVLGERADRELIRRGKDSARVEALLFVDAKVLASVFEEYGIRPEEELVIARDISLSGKNVCRVNGSIVNLSTLKGLMDHVVDLVGQHEHQSLLYSVNHLRLIDSFGGKPIEKLKESAAALLQKLRSTEKEIASLGGDETERKQSMDLLQFQITELEGAALHEGELEELVQERNILSNAQHIMEKLGYSYNALYEGDESGLSALSMVKGCVDSVLQLAQFGTEYEALAARLEEGYYALEEVAHDIGASMGAVVFDADRQNEVEERIEYINTLKRKYGVSDELELIAFAEDARQKLDRLAHSDEIHASLHAEAQETRSTLYELFAKLSKLRKKEGVRLSKLVINELEELGMKGACFEAKFAVLPSPEDAVYTHNGLDSVEFYISTNVGEPLKPLSKTASGGEVSRIMLAFKNITAETDQISTMIFDEIDTGISGKMAHVVAEKMASIAKNRQVICVTHLAQIAAMADRSFLISKESSKNSTNTEIKHLEEEAVLEEIARLSGGIHSQNAMNYAGELLANARAIKGKL